MSSVREASRLMIDRDARRVDVAGTIYVDGQWTQSATGVTLPVIDPATGRPVGTISAGGYEDVQHAVAAAKRAAKGWARTDATTRAGLLRRVSQLVAQNAEELAWLEALDTGHYITKARDLVGAVSMWLDYHAGLADKVGGRTIPMGGNRLSLTLLEPLGVTGHIIPWNYPLVLFVRSAAPALALGNTVVLKPAEDTTLASLRLTELFDEAGFPPGVLNVVTGLGPDAGAPLAAHPDVAGITFTGSTETGRVVAKLGAEHMAQLNLELGGKSPIIVFPDARIDDAVEAAIQGFCSHAGQVCIASTRLFLHVDIQEEFLAKLKARLASVVVGDSFDDATTMGALVSQKHYDRVREYVEIGKSEATLFYGGGVPEGTNGGYFVEPTVFVDVPADSRIASEEIFGPVIAAIPWSSRDELIEKANDSVYGLFASVWSQDITSALSIAKDLEAGGVMVNDWESESPLAPHGGFKMSGLGRENGLECVSSYTQVKHVLINLDSSLKESADWASAPL